MPESEVFNSSAHSIQPNRWKRLDYLDGIRGLAAIYVVIYHIYVNVSEQLQAVEKPSISIWLVQTFLSHGRISVAAFIVLSGYCLMLPVVRSTDGHIKGGYVSYFLRRAHRIVPPYYAALILSLLLTFVIPMHLIPAMGSEWNSGQPALNSGAIISHILLVQNFSDNWEYKINGAMWSVALEWQIYFLFPLVLLPIWRRFGIAALLVTTCIIVPFIVHFLVHGRGLNTLLYVALFALGMAGSAIGFSNQSSLQRYKAKIPWNQLAIFWVALWIALAFSQLIDVVTIDQLLGPAVICMIIACSVAVTEDRFNICLRLFEWRWATILGTFSYSLYLTHELVLGGVELCLSGTSMTPMLRLFVMIVLVLPLSILFAYLFYLMFEKPFMSHVATQAIKEKQA